MLPIGSLTATTTAALLLATRLVPRSDRPVTLSTDLLWMGISALMLVGVGGVWLGTFPLADSVAITTSDFTEYCRSVTAMVEGTPRWWSPNRSVLSGLPATWAARHLGVQDGLLVGAWVGQAFLGAGLYAWGRALHSPLAGVGSVVAAGALVPLAALGRMLTFYPAIVGGLCFATGLVALYWRHPGRRTAVLAGVGVGLALLVDLRGLVWALPLVGLAGLRALTVRHTRNKVLHLAILVALVAIAHRLGPSAYLEQSTTLEVLSDLTKGWKDIVWVPHVRVPDSAATGYVWGRSPLVHIPDTLSWLADQGARVPPTLRTHPYTLRARAQLLDPLEPWLMGAAVVAALGLLRSPRLLLFALGSGLPYAVALEGAIAARFAGLRFLGNGAPLLALVAGVGMAVLVVGPVRTRRPPPRIGMRGVMALGLLQLVVLGALPSDLSPLSHWRARYKKADAGLLTACPAPPHLPQTPTLLYQLP